MLHIEHGAEHRPDAAPAVTGCTCLHGVLARALDAVMGCEDAEIGTVLALAEAQRAGVRAALARAFEAEAARFAALSQRAYAAADRLAARSCP